MTATLQRLMLKLLNFNAQKHSHCPQQFNSQNRWIISGCKHIGVIAGRCRLILNDWDEHVIISTTGLSLEDSYCVPQNVVIIEGRCRDFTALRAQKAPDNQSCLDAENKSSTGFQFCLLKSFIPLTAAGSITQNVTIQINSLNDLNAVEGFSSFTAKDSLNTKQLLNYLKNNNVDALFCADSVSDDLIYSVALTGVVLVRTYIISHFTLPLLFQIFFRLIFFASPYL